MAMIQNFFFDLYGTFVDIRTDESRPSLWRSTAEFYSLCGALYTPDELRKRYLALCEEETALLAAKSPSLGQAEVEIELRSVFRRLFEEKGVDAVPEIRIEDAARLFRSLSFRKKPRLMAGAKKTLTGLRRRGTHLYLLSSDFGVKKPSPVFFRAALDRAGLDAGEVLMIGNDPDADIRGADSVGMASRYYHTWQSPPRGTPLPASCREIGSLEELLEE